MNDREFAKQKRRIKALIEKWVRPIGLGQWTIKFEYSRDRLGDSHVAEYDLLAKTTCSWEYKHGMVEFSMPGVAQVDDEELERAFVHELMHIFLNEMRDWKDDNNHEERVATELASAFLWMCAP